MNKTAAAILIAATASIAMVDASPARAEVEYAWCAIGQNQGAQSCSFSTQEQCRSFLSGNGFCQMNARATQQVEKPRRVR